MLRNVASQKYRVYAWDATTGLAKTGDAANISAHIRKDDAASAATNDTNPTEASATNEPGYYDFDLTQSETDAIKVSLVPKSATANIQVVACPPVVYTRPQYFSVLGIASDGDLTKVNTLDGHTPQTGDTYAIVNSGTHGNAALKTLIDNVDNFVDTEVAEILTRIGSPSVSITADIAALNDIAAADVWAVGTRSLTILDEDSTTLDLDATIRAAIGLSSANLDTQLTAIDDFVDTEVSTILTRIGVPAVSLSADIAAIEAQTDDIGTAGAGLTAIPWNSSWDAEVQSEVADALAVYDPPTKAELDSAVANVSVDEIQATALADLFNTDSLTTYASAVAGSVVKEIADNAGGSGLTVQQIVDGVWDEALVDHLDAGSTGEALNAAGAAGDPWTTTLPGAYTGSQAGKILADILVDTGTTLQGELDDIETDVNSILTRIGVPSVSITADIAALNDLSTSDIDARLVAIGLDHLVSASVTGTDVTDNSIIARLVSKSATADWDTYIQTTDSLEALRDRGDAAWVTATGFSTHSASDIWAVGTRLLTAGTNIVLTKGTGVTGFNDLSASDVRTAVGLTSANLDTQLAKLDTIDDFLDTEISTILTRIGVPATSLTASIAALNNISTAQVNAEVVDALNVDTYAEPTGIPAATASLVSKIGRLYKALMRGIEITATEKRFLDSASSSEWKKTLSDDGTTYEETSALAP